MVRGGWVVGFQEPTHTLIPDGIVVFEGNKISHVGRSFDGPVDHTIDARGKLVAPGFIDTHVHCGHHATLHLFADVGRPDFFGQPFFEITVSKPGTFVHGDPRYNRPEQEAADELADFADFTVVELLRNGVTTFVEFGAHVHVQKALARSIEKYGTRGYLGAGYNEGRWVGGERGQLVRVIDKEKGQQLFDDAVAFCKEIDGAVGGRANGMLVAHGVEITSHQQLLDTVTVARDLDVPIAIHAAYSIWEFYDVVREQLKTPIEYLESIKMLELGPKVNIGHGNFVAEHPRLAYSGGRDIEILGHHGCTVSHCSVNLVRRARYLDHWQKYRKAGVNLSLGSDTYPRDMVLNMRTASYFGKVLGRDLAAVPAQEVFEAATLNGAKSLGRSDLGRLAVGAKADIIVIDLSGRDTLRYGPVRDPIRSLVECGIGDDVETVIVDGRVCMENRIIPDLDLVRLRDSAQRVGERMWADWATWDPQGRSAEQVNPWSFPIQLGH
jgi:cytosine/adenosine deaminase-related metal-dependent hydrolase